MRQHAGCSIPIARAQQKGVSRMSSNEKLIVLDDVCKHFKVSGGMLKAVDHISLDIYKGETLGLVGESGCGKSTLGRVAMGIYPATSGKLYYAGEELNLKNAATRFKYAKKAQIIFQDPYSSLSPRLPIGEIIGEAVREHGLVPKEQFDDYITKVMKDCGLQEYHKDRYPHEFSGGQRQRVGIARALAVDPEFIVCDEPVSALDVSIQAQVVNMFEDLQQEMGLTYLFIAHDLSVVKHISNRIGVMYLGKMVELADSFELIAHSVHPYTRSLLSAIPMPSPRRERKKKLLVYDPSMHDYSTEAPQWRELRPRHWVLCSASEAEDWCRES